jgi:hypothetical protein
MTRGILAPSSEPAEERKALLGRDSHNAVPAVGDPALASCRCVMREDWDLDPYVLECLDEAVDRNLHATRRNLAGPRVFADHGDVYSCPSTR